VLYNYIYPNIQHTEIYHGHGHLLLGDGRPHVMSQRNAFCITGLLGDMLALIFKFPKRFHPYYITLNPFHLYTDVWVNDKLIILYLRVLTSCIVYKCLKIFKP